MTPKATSRLGTLTPENLERLLWRGAGVHDGHQGTCHASRILVLNNVAPIDDARRPLLHDFEGSAQDFLLRGLSASPHKDRNPSGYLDHLVVLGNIVARVGLDHIGAEFYRLANQGQDLFQIPVNHVPSLRLIGLHDERLDHQRHSHRLAPVLEPRDIVQTLPVQLRLIREKQQVYDDTGSIEAESLSDGIFNKMAEERTWQPGSVHICN